MNTPDSLTELRNYVAGQVVASEKAIAYINQLHEEREQLLLAIKELLQLNVHRGTYHLEGCSCRICTIARMVR